MHTYYKLRLALKLATKALEKINNEISQKTLEEIANMENTAKIIKFLKVYYGVRIVNLINR